MTREATEARRVLTAWVDAWNARDADALARLAGDDVELILHRGIRRGIPALREVIHRQTFGIGLYVELGELYGRGATIVAHGAIELRFVESGEVVERKEDGGAAFTIHDGRVARFRPYPDGATALRAEGLTESDRLEP